MTKVATLDLFIHLFVYLSFFPQGVSVHLNIPWNLLAAQVSLELIILLSQPPWC